MITKKEAGTVNGKAVAQYTLENENGLAMTRESPGMWSLASIPWMNT